jgi:DNA-binding transcriptional LysR family regulator
MRFRGLDLNLLVALDTLLVERSVSNAAERLNLTQSAMSGSLKRLRDYFGDELLVPGGRRLLLTARSEALAGPVREALMQIESAIAQGVAFDPSASTRNLTMMASDYAIATLVAPGIADLTARAPKMTFSITPTQDHPVERVDRGECDIAFVGEHSVVAAEPHRLMLDDEYVIVCWSKNRYVSGGVTAHQYAELGHISIQLVQTPHTLFEDWLRERHGLRRRIEVIAPSFSALPELVLGTDRLATLQRRLAEWYVERMPLSLYPLPWRSPAVRTYAIWRRSRGHDPALAWVIDCLEQVGRELASGRRRE